MRPDSQISCFKLGLAVLKHAEVRQGPSLITRSMHARFDFVMCSPRLDQSVTAKERKCSILINAIYEIIYTQYKDILQSFCQDQARHVHACSLVDGRTSECVYSHRARKRSSQKISSLKGVL